MNDDIKIQGDALFKKAQELQSSVLGFDAVEVLGHMTKSGINDPMEAFNDLKGDTAPLVDTPQVPEQSEFEESLNAKLHETRETRPIPQINNDNLKEKLREALGITDE